MFNPLIPLPSESPDTSSSPVQVNFAQFAAIFSQNPSGVIYNHMSLNDSNQGKHAAVLMENQSSDPGVMQDLTVLFNKNAPSASGTQPQLFVQIPKFLPTSADPTDAKNISMQLTYNSVNTIGPQYQSFLPGGYLLYFGSTNTIGSAIVLSPIPTEILCAIALPTGVGNAKNGGATRTNVPYDSNVAVTQPKTVKINSSRAPSGATFYYLIIAKA